MGRERAVGVTLFMLVTVGVLAAVASGADEPTRTGTPNGRDSMHAGAVTTIATDQSNRYLVTGSEDRTVRVWDLPTGRLLRVITPPGGNGDAGEILAVAISPDGRTVACGGNTGGRSNPQQGGKTYFDAYVYDRESGRLLHTLPLPFAVDGLKYSRDGKFLVATSLGGFASTSTDYGAERVFTAADYAWAKDALIPNDGAAKTFADFDGQGRLVVMRKFGTWLMETGGKGASESREVLALPTSLSVSPDGARIAVAFADSTVGVYSGQDLSLLYTPDVKGVGPAEVEFTDGMELAEVGLGSVAWSADGAFLYYSGGRTCVNDACVIRKWSDGGRGPFKDVIAAGARITQLVALQKGGVAYASVEPSVGVLDVQDSRALFLANADAAAARRKSSAASTEASSDDAGAEGEADGPGCFVGVGQDNATLEYKPGKWGFIDKSGHAVIAPQFGYATSFSNGRAAVAVKSHRRLGFIDKQGAIVIPPAFEPPVGDFHDGLAWAASGDKYGYIDTTGRMVIAPQFGAVSDFSEGLAVVRVSGKPGYGYIDKSGTIVIRLQFEEANPFSQGLAAVWKKDKWGYIDRTGKTVFERRFDAAWAFAEGLARVRDEPCLASKPRCGESYIDKSGKTVISDVRPASDGSFSEGLAMIHGDDYRNGFIDKTGKTVIAPTLEQAEPFAEGLASVMKDDRWGYIDTQGRIAIPYQFERADSFKEGLALVRRNGKIGYIDKTGAFAVQPLFDDAWGFSEGLAAVCLGTDSLGLLPAAPVAAVVPPPIAPAGEAVTPPHAQPVSTLASPPSTLSESDVKTLAELHRQITELSQRRKYVEALPLARRALDLVEESADADDPAAEQPCVDLAHVQYAIGEYRRAAGESYLGMPEYREARTLYERALAIQERRLGQNNPQLAELLDDQGALLCSIREYDEAADVLQRVLALRTSAYGPNDPRTATSTTDLASLRVMKLASNKRFLEAFAAAQTVLENAERTLGPDHPSVALAVANLAELYSSFRVPYLQASADLHERALAIRERTLGPDHWGVVLSLRALGKVSVARKDNGSASRAYARALGIEEKVLGADDPSIAKFMESLGEFRPVPGRYADAELFYQRALAIREKEDQGYKIAGALEDLGDVYRAEGEYAKAEPLFARALAIREQHVGPNHVTTAETLRRLGTVHRVSGAYARAQPLYQRAIAIHQEHQDLAASWALRDGAALALAQEDYRSALRLLTEGLTAEEPTLRNLLRPGREEAQLEAIQSRYVSGSYYFFLALVARHFKKDPRALQTAMELVLRRKGIVFEAQSLAKSAGAQSPAAQQKQGELSVARSELSALLLHKPTAMTEEEYREKLAVAFERASTLEEGIAYLPGSPSEGSEPPVTLAAVAAALPKGAALLEIVEVPDFDYAREDFDFPKREWTTSARYLAFVLRPSKQVALVDLGRAAALDAAAALVIEDMRNREAPEWRRHLADLYTRLWVPLVGDLGGVDRVLISADGALNLVPFAALIDAEGRFLLERYLLAYVNTGRELLATAAPAPAPTSDLLLVANPAFDMDATGSAGYGNAFASRDFHQRFEALNGTEREASDIPPLVSAARGQSVLVGTQATEQALKRVHSPRILHLATHGFFLPDQTLGTEGRYENSLVRSGLALAGANRAAQTGAGEDGLLTALEVTGIDLSGTELVVLSACNTGVGEVKAGEGVVGLRRAFALAGAKNVMVSLWPVRDDVTADEMKLFYGNLQHMPPAEALRKAQLDTIRELKVRDGAAAPQLWAPFILQGGRALSVATN